MSINLSSDDETMHLPSPDAPADHKAPTADDAGNVGAATAEANALVPIVANAPEMPKSPAVDQVLVVPPSGRRGSKRSQLTTRRSNPVPQTDQVMTQVELPPYCGPCSPLDLLAIENIFGHIFEAFKQMPQAAAAGAVPVADNKPLKRGRCPPLKKVLVPRYSDSFIS
jgi:hypothetical protein